MKNLYILIFGLVLFASCKNPKADNNPETQEIVIKKENEVQVVVQKILDLPKLQGMFHH